MRMRRIIGSLAVTMGAVGASEGSAEVLFLSAASNAEAYASAAAGGTAYATGGQAHANVRMHTLAVSKSSATNTGIGGSVSASLGFAASDFMGVSTSSTSITGAPIITTAVNTTTKTSGESMTTTTVTTTSTAATTTTTEIETRPAS